MKSFSGSFRDPAGQVYELGGKIVRSINPVYQEDWQFAHETGLLKEMQEKGWMPSFHTVTPPTPQAWTGIEVERIPYITYPYEWSFSQLQDGALLTLDMHLAAIRRNMVLKDASAYNIQFVGAAPCFIDILSFERWGEGRPWQAYRQFCMHFLAPLALMRYLGLWAGTLSKLRTDGISLAYAASMLPLKARMKPGLAIHLFAHAAMEKRHVDARSAAGKVKKASLTQKGLQNLALSLRELIEGLSPPGQKTQWGDYYNDTNYSNSARAFKLSTVERIARETGDSNALAIDIGANTGTFTACLEPYFSYILAPDIDPLAVDIHYKKLHSAGSRKILPMVLDLSNPSPALGWACKERDSFMTRSRAKLVIALALLHHLTLTEGIPFEQSATFFSDLLEEGGVLAVEFVPPEDTQVQRMTAARPNFPAEYSLQNFRSAFAAFFEEVECVHIVDSTRTLFVFRKR